MANDIEKKPASGERGMIVELPGRIADSCCSNCGADLRFLIEQIHKGEIGLPEFCPQCRKPFREEGNTELIWKCGNCGVRIIDPSKEKFCKGCGRKLIYPPELLATPSTEKRPT